MMRAIVPALLAAAAITAAASAQVHVKEEIITAPTGANWQFDGAPKVKLADAAGVPGGKALAITIPAKTKNPWDVQARATLAHDIEVGDIVTFGFYARAEKPDPGKETATLGVQVQRNGPPYDAAVGGSVELGKDYVFHCVGGPAKIALKAGELMVTVQLGADKHVVDFGPFFATRIPAAGGPNAKSGLPCGKAPGAA